SKGNRRHHQFSALSALAALFESSSGRYIRWLISAKYFVPVALITEAYKPWNSGQARYFVADDTLRDKLKAASLRTTKHLNSTSSRTATSMDRAGKIGKTPFRLWRWHSSGDQETSLLGKANRVEQEPRATHSRNNLNI